ncbi:peroxidase-related enzyme [Psychrobacter jeotgali]|uniref:peroxidase-related enzyme n=1 Tax=Psychrobacter jeotgali TaxID=179010 RepID=UPI00191856D6|nr:peroxidase-related enzyme [Psychrobacter jeotgali]
MSNPAINSSTKPTISQYPVPALDSLPADILERILAVQEKAKFIPNVFLALAYRPAEFRAFFAYYDAVMEREGSTLSPAEKEMIIVATSAANGCQYCVIAHGALLRVFSKEPLLADQIAINYLHAPLSAKQKEMLARFL